MFFFNLPGSGIEIDIPLIGYFPVWEGAGETPPDRGLLPEVAVEAGPGDLVGDRDPVLEAALERARSAD